MEQLSLLTRYSIGLYKRYYNIIWILKFKNIFKVSLKEAIIKNSNFWQTCHFKAKLKNICLYFNVDISLEDIKKSYSYRKRKRTLKVFSISEEEHKKLIQKSQEMSWELKYGVKNPYQLEKVKEKMKKTKLERYGDENFNNLEKCKKTKLKKYGSENYVNIEKMKQTNLEKYGVENVYQSKEIIKKCKQTCLERYGDEKFRNSLKIKQTKLERYGDENFNNRDKAKETNLEKYGTDSYSKTEDFIEKTKKTKLERSI